MLRFNICQTFETVTPESSALGDFEEAGFEIDPASDWRLKEIIHELKRQGIEHYQVNISSIQFSSGFHCVCYKTAEDKQLTFFVKDLKPRQVARLDRVFRSVFKNKYL